MYAGVVIGRVTDVFDGAGTFEGKIMGGAVGVMSYSVTM